MCVQLTTFFMSFSSQIVLLTLNRGECRRSRDRDPEKGLSKLWSYDREEEGKAWCIVVHTHLSGWHTAPQVYCLGLGGACRRRRGGGGGGHKKEVLP